MNEASSMNDVVLVSLKRRDAFSSFVHEVAASIAMSQAAHLPISCTETSWSSTFHMFNGTYKAPKALHLTVQRYDELNKHYGVKNLWLITKEAMDFLEVFAIATED